MPITMIFNTSKLFFFFIDFHLSKEMKKWHYNKKKFFKHEFISLHKRNKTRKKKKI